MHFFRLSVEGIHPADPATEALWDAKLTKLLWWERGQQQAIDVHNPSRDRQHTVNVKGVQDALKIDGPKQLSMPLKASYHCLPVSYFHDLLWHKLTYWVYLGII